MGEGPSRRVVLAANSSWNIVNFRAGLIRALRDAGYEVVVVTPADPASSERMDALGVDWRPVAIDRSGLNPFADLRLLNEYRRIFREVQPIAVLGFTIKPNIYGAIAARRLRIPMIANVSGLGTVFIKRGLLLSLVTILYRAALRSAAIIFFQNPDDRQMFIDRRIVRPEQARLLPGSGVDLDRFRPQPLPDWPLTFLFVGRLLADKGVREFVNAARALRDELPGAKFQILGPLDSQNRTAIPEEEVQRWVAEGCVEYLGATEDVRPAIAAATAIVLPSYREGLPRSLLEAGAMGRPLIATDVPGCREVVIEGETGFRCEARTSASLANTMKKLAILPDQDRKLMGQSARARVEQSFSEKVVIDAYLDALENFRASGS